MSLSLSPISCKAGFQDARCHGAAVFFTTVPSSAPSNRKLKCGQLLVGSYWYVRLNSWIQTHQHTQWCSVTQQPSHEVKCESPRKRPVLNMYQWLSMCMHHSNRAYNPEETLQKTELTIAYKFPWVYCNYIIYRYGMFGGLSERRCSSKPCNGIRAVLWHWYPWHPWPDVFPEVNLTDSCKKPNSALAELEACRRALFRRGLNDTDAAMHA